MGFFVVLNIFLAILNDAYTVVHTEDKWEELEKRKPRSLREKFEVQKAMWRERKNLMSYRDIFSSFGTLFLILLGEFDFDEMAEVSWLWATLFFILYVIFMFFVVLNIFLAILNDAYTVVHQNDMWEELEKRVQKMLS